MAGVVNPSDIREETTGDLTGLGALLQQIVGQPFLFFRETYGDELTIHFGALKEVMSPKLRKRQRGSYVLTLRGSVWKIEGGATPGLYLTGPVAFPPGSTSELKPFPLAAFEQQPPIEPGAIVITAKPFLDTEYGGGIGVYFVFSDRSLIVIRPNPADLILEADPDLPRIADWELFTPHSRYLRVGPGSVWSYTASKRDVPSA
ncbi:MAG TPA: hypothetical protein VFG68_16175 [Fimbriiglobus sp.]|nr:hypothetical protein [Fimbriiglobus sp.]